MEQTYLLTGATGFLGRSVVQLLLLRGCRVAALVTEKDPLCDTLPEEVVRYRGDLTDKASMRDFFAGGGNSFCVLHCAGIVSVASRPGEIIYRVNVDGTQNVIDLCREFGAEKLVYVSSVHAIAEKPAQQTITEPNRFSPEDILGDYGKSKAMATALVLKAAQSGLNASVVLPSGILGQPRGTEHRKGRERDVQDQEQQRFPAGALQLFPGLFLARGLRRFGLPRRFKPAAHPLSASFTCVPASIGLVEVVMTNSPAPMPEMADIVSSCASTCTGTRVAV